METIKFTRKKQLLDFIISECRPKIEEINELENTVDVKFIETVGYDLGIRYSNQYGHDRLYTDKYEKCILLNLKRTLLWDINYAINKHIKEIEFNIKYLKFVKKYGHLFDTYKQAIESFHEFMDNDTVPTEIDTKKVENVESFDDETCKNQISFLNAVQKDLQNYQNRQARKKQLNEETTEIDTENVDNVENVETTEKTIPCKNCQSWKYDGQGLHMERCQKMKHASAHDDGIPCKNYRSNPPTGDAIP